MGNECPYNDTKYLRLSIKKTLEVLSKRPNAINLPFGEIAAHKGSS